MAKGKIYFSVCVYVHRTHKSVVIKRNEWIFATHERLCNWAVRRNAREHQQYNAENLELRVPTFSLPPISLARRSPRVSQVSKKYRGNRSRPFVRIYSWRHYVRVLAKAKFVNSSLPTTTLISDSKKMQLIKNITGLSFIRKRRFALATKNFLHSQKVRPFSHWPERNCVIFNKGVPPNRWLGNSPSRRVSDSFSVLSPSPTVYQVMTRARNWFDVGHYRRKFTAFVFYRSLSSQFLSPSCRGEGAIAVYSPRLR